jgi:hypothetical protein
MSKTLTLELSDELYATLQQQASAAGLSIEEWLLTSAQTRSLPHNPSQKSSDFLMAIAGLGSSNQQDISGGSYEC